MASPADTEDLKDQQTPEASSTSDTDQDTPDSSNPNPSEEQPSTFDVVMNALNNDGEDKDGRSSEEDKSQKPESDNKQEGKKDTDDDFEDFTPEERKNLKKATTERFDKLKGLYRSSKEENQSLKGQLEQATVEAGHYRKFVDFLEDNRLSQEDANNLFHLGALFKNDPARALQELTPFYNELLRITGNVLPNDLQQQVEQGYITRDRALELSRLRATGQVERQIRSERETHQQQRDAARQQNETVSSIQSAISDWERKWSSSDFDYAKKKDRVLDRVELLLVRAERNGTLPKTVDEAVKLANQAKAEVEADLRKMSPPRKQVTMVDGGSSASNMPEPKNTADVIRRALNQ